MSDLLNTCIMDSVAVKARQQRSFSTISTLSNLSDDEIYVSYASLAIEETPVEKSTPEIEIVAGKGHWSIREHSIFLETLNLRPAISWTEVAKFITTRNPRQVRTHAQKYYQKLKRRDGKRQEFTLRGGSAKLETVDKFQTSRRRSASGPQPMARPEMLDTLGTDFAIEKSHDLCPSRSRSVSGPQPMARHEMLDVFQMNFAFISDDPVMMDQTPLTTRPRCNSSPQSHLFDSFGIEGVSIESPYNNTERMGASAPVMPSSFDMKSEFKMMTKPDPITHSSSFLEDQMLPHIPLASFNMKQEPALLEQTEMFPSSSKFLDDLMDI